MDATKTGASGESLEVLPEETCKKSVPGELPDVPLACKDEFHECKECGFTTNKGRHGTNPWPTKSYLSKIETSLRETGGTMTITLPYRQWAMVKNRLNILSASMH